MLVACVQHATYNIVYMSCELANVNTAHKLLTFIVAGTVTHSLDYRKSAGGFIHGFCYTSKLLMWDIILMSS